MTAVGVLMLIVWFGVVILHKNAERNSKSEKYFDSLKAAVFQIGLVMVGAGASITTYFVQQQYQREYDVEQKRNDALSILGRRISLSTISYIKNIKPYDELLDEGTPFIGLQRSLDANVAMTALRNGGEAFIVAINKLSDIEMDTTFTNIARRFDFSDDLNNSIYLSRIASDDEKIAYADDSQTFGIVAEKTIPLFHEIQETVLINVKDLNKKITSDDLIRKNELVLRQRYGEIIEGLHRMRSLAVRLIARHCVMHYLISQVANEGELRIPAQFASILAQREERNYTEFLSANRGLLSAAKFGTETCWSILEYDGKSKPEQVIWVGPTATGGHPSGKPKP